MPKKKKRKTASFIKNEVVKRSVIFLLIVYALVPFLFWFISKQGKPPVYNFNFASFSLFTLLLIGVFAAYNKKDLLTFQPKKNRYTPVLVLLAFLSFFAAYWFRFLPSVQFFARNTGFVIIMSYVMYFFGALFVGLVLFTPAFFSTNGRSLLMTGIVTYIFFMFTNVLWSLWGFLSRIVTWLVSTLLSFTYPSVFVSSGSGDPLLSVGGFSAIIGEPCSGVESLSMFTGLFILAAAYDWQRVHNLKMWIIFFFGAVGMFLVNVFRVYLLMVIGVYDAGLSITLFHSNLGWILFVGYTLAFASFAYPRILKK